MGLLLRALVVALALGGAWIALSPADDVAPRQQLIAGYLPHYRFAAFDDKAAAPLTDLILFSAEPTATGEIDFHNLEQAPWQKLRALQRDQKMRVLVCIGGWGNSSPFPKVAASAALRKKFVQSALKYCRDNQLQGIDLDWESPRTADEGADCAKLVGELRAAFDPAGLLVSLTMAPWRDLPAEAYASAHRVQLMCYDNGQRHSTFEHARKDVEKFLTLKIPAEKLLLGVPFYGRDIDRRERTRTYRDLHAAHHPAAEVNELDGVFFNGRSLISRKAQLAREKQLGGLMIWEIGQDAPGEASLIRAIADEFAIRAVR